MEAAQVREIERLGKAAHQQWGKAHQLRVGAEECAELISALLRLEREDRTDPFGSLAEMVCEEVADVIISTMSLRLMLGPDMVDKAIRRKLQRLADRITAAKMAGGK